MTRAALALLALTIPATAAAHPLPNMRFDRSIDVRLTATGVTVQYALELNEWTMVLDGKNLVTPEEAKAAATPRGFAKLYADKKSVLIADDLRASLGGKELKFRVEKKELEPERDHLRLKLTFRANWTLSAAGQPFAFEDQNFEDRSGVVTLYLKSSDDLDLSDVEEPIDLRNKSPLAYKPGDDKRARRASATVTSLRPPTPAAPPTETPPPAPIPEPSLVQNVRDRGLVALFDSDVGLGVLLVLSALFGMAHAFTPGHGKTMVAAYLVGERGTVAHAVVLGIVTTFAHTGGVIALGVVLYSVWGNRPPAEAQGWITLAGGLLIALVGLWLFVTRVRGKADHVHLFGGHHHHHDGHDHHHHEPPKATTGVGWVRVVLLGLGGGIIPCYDAVLMFVVALNLGRVGLAIPLLVAFSVGLAAVLVALGVGVVYANRAGGRRFADRKWFQFLPAISAAVLIGLGVWFARDGWRLVTEATP